MQAIDSCGRKGTNKDILRILVGVVVTVLVILLIVVIFNNMVASI